jgi:HEAT repeat protein
MSASRKVAALAGHRGDEPTARRLLTDDDGRVRATALGALDRMGKLTDGDVRVGLSDADAVVRRRACELAATHPDVLVEELLADSDTTVVEAACWAMGERGFGGLESLAALSAVATGHDDPLCREAAIAALGAIGDPAGLPAILTGTTDKPAVRRRAVLALAPFDGDAVDAALQRALTDRDWQVRQAAEDLLR